MQIKERYPEVEFIDLNRVPVVVKTIEDPYEIESTKVARCLDEEFDVFINLPIMKTHVVTTASLSMKNLKGVIPPPEKRRYHDLNVDRCVADLATVAVPDLVIADGTIGSEGLGPKEGSPVALGVVVAGTNMVTVDSACLSIMGFDPKEVNHVNLAHKKLGGAISADEMEWLGDSLEKVYRKFKPAIPVLPEEGRIKIISGRPCSGCISTAVVLTSRLTESGVLDWLNERGIYPTVAIGNDFPKDTQWPDAKDLFFIGNCAKKVAEGKGNFFPGCPAAVIHVTEYLSKIYGFDHSVFETGADRAEGKHVNSKEENSGKEA